MLTCLHTHNFSALFVHARLPDQVGWVTTDGLKLQAPGVCGMECLTFNIIVFDMLQNKSWFFSCSSFLYQECSYTYIFELLLFLVLR